MPLIQWICSNCRKINRAPHHDQCEQCLHPRIQRTASIHVSERVVVDRHNSTGQLSIPGRADVPIHPKAAAAGYERVEINSYKELRGLESKGLVHEATNYNSPPPPPDAKY